VLRLCSTYHFDNIVVLRNRKDLDPLKIKANLDLENPNVVNPDPKNLKEKPQLFYIPEKKNTESAPRPR
jgi:hypothetical protein